MSPTLKFYLIYLGALSLFSFLLYGIDKGRARRGAWRIPEKVLLLSSLLGGAFGGFLAMELFRHKTKHWYFVFFNILGMLLHGGAVVLLLT